MHFGEIKAKSNTKTREEQPAEISVVHLEVQRGSEAVENPQIYTPSVSQDSG